MLRVAVIYPTLRVVDDQVGSPTSAADLAAAITIVAARLASDPNAPSSIVQFIIAGKVSWAGFPREIFRQSTVWGGLSATVAPIATTPTLARRPSSPLLSHAAVRAAYGITPHLCQDAMGDILNELIGTAS